MTEPLRISPSKLEMLSRCGVQYEFRYLRKIRQPPGIAALEGRAVDSAVSAYLIEKALARAAPDEAGVADLAATAMREEWEKAGGDVAVADDEMQESIHRLRDRSVDRAVRLSRHYRVWIGPLVDPHVDEDGKVRVQHPWEIEAGDGVLLTGRSDCEEADGGVDDLKTSAKRYHPAAADRSVQLTGYAVARRAIDGIQTPRVALHVLVDRSPAMEGIVAGFDPAGVTHQVLESRRGRFEMEGYLKRVEAAAKVIRAGAFFPARPDDWWCSKKFCGYFDRCPYAVRPVSVAVGEPGDEMEVDDGDE